MAREGPVLVMSRVLEAEETIERRQDKGDKRQGLVLAISTNIVCITFCDVDQQGTVNRART